MSLKFYSEVRGSLHKKDTKTINPETLSKIFKLFIIEKNFSEKYRYRDVEYESYAQRSLFSTLNGYTSAELFMSRLSLIEKKNILILLDIITNGIRRRIKHHDFNTLMAIGSSTYSESYWSALQAAINNFDYKIVNPSEKTIYEDWNVSYEQITKEQIQNTINQRGNDIDLVLTGFKGGDIARGYRDYKRNSIMEKTLNGLETTTLRTILRQFVYKEITRENFLELVEIDDKEGFFDLHQQLYDGNQEGAESWGAILLGKYKVKLSKQGKTHIPSIANEDILDSLKTNKEDSRRLYVRTFYLTNLIPSVLRENNISYTHEGYREDGSDYMIDHTHKTITKEKYINPSYLKKGCLIVQFPDCRPIHLNVDTLTIQELYYHEHEYNKPFSLLSHQYVEREEFLSTDWNEKRDIPDHLSLEEQIQYVRKNKPKVNWEKIIEAKRNQSKKIIDDDEELSF